MFREGHLVFAITLLWAFCFDASAEAATADSTFEISFPASVRRQPVVGRVFIIISRLSRPEPRLQTGWITSPPLFGVDVEGLRPGEPAIVDTGVLGYPLHSLKDIPAGDYEVQALLNVYTEFHRADGHTLWAHADQWEGQQFNISPGNLYSKPQKLHLDASVGYRVKLNLTQTLPAIQVPPDTPWVQCIKIQSTLLSRFWGRPVDLGAVVLLPRDYSTRNDVRYPVIYSQGHFSLAAPLSFDTDQDFARAWTSEHFPRLVAVTLQHPTPYYDESYAVNSANNGPYDDAIMTELIPYIEKHFRIIREPYARVLTGASAGGLNSMRLQIHHPEFFGGTWSFCPAEIDLRSFYVLNIYEDKNAFFFQPQGVLASSFGQDWRTPERYLMRMQDGQPVVTVRQVSQLEAVLGSRGRSGLWFDPSAAAYGPVGKDGYPIPLFDKITGDIDRDIATDWRERGYDLRDYTQKNWSTIGPLLVGKLHLYVGDMDEFYVNSGVYLFDEFLRNTQVPYYEGSVEYGRPMKGHGWTPMNSADRVKIMAEHIARDAPSTADWGWK